MDEIPFAFEYEYDDFSFLLRTGSLEVLQRPCFAVMKRETYGRPETRGE
jgi:hypothetical protein